VRGPIGQFGVLDAIDNAGDLAEAAGLVGTCADRRLAGPGSTTPDLKSWLA